MQSKRFFRDWWLSVLLIGLVSLSSCEREQACICSLPGIEEMKNTTITSRRQNFETEAELIAEARKVKALLPTESCCAS